jgi:hypothetical protein
MALDPRVRAILKELGAALNDAVSSSEKVHEIFTRLKEQGFDPYLIFDVTIGLGSKGGKTSASIPSIRRGAADTAHRDGVAFRIDVKDLTILKSLGIDPTRPVRSRRPKTATLTVRSALAKKS